MKPIRRLTIRSTLLLLGRLALAAVFLYAAYGKLRPVNSAPWTFASFHITRTSLDVSQMLFATQVDSYQLLPSWAVLFVARSLPWFELTLGILLLVGFGLRWVSLVTTLLVAAFVGVILRTYFAGLQINCGCFGPGAEPLNGWTILRDGLFLALAAAVTTGAFLEARAARKTSRESIVDFV
jgi:uncharacterized membrane protein YphA (DoxX/SURF4 family)